MIEEWVGRVTGATAVTRSNTVLSRASRARLGVEPGSAPYGSRWSARVVSRVTMTNDAAAEIWRAGGGALFGRDRNAAAADTSATPTTSAPAAIRARRPITTLLLGL